MDKAHRGVIMIILVKEYPMIDDSGNVLEGLVKHFATDEKGKNYYIKQLETGTFYESAIDVYPCQYTYEVTDIPVEELENAVEEGKIEESV